MNKGSCGHKCSKAFSKFHYWVITCMRLSVCFLQHHKCNDATAASWFTNDCMRNNWREFKKYLQIMSTLENIKVILGWENILNRWSLNSLMIWRRWITFKNYKHYLSEMGNVFDAILCKLWSITNGLNTMKEKRQACFTIMLRFFT